MGLLVPVALAALPLLLIIVALYLLRLRRPVAPVGSLHLWDSLTRDREANTLWQRLRVSVLLLLQLAALLALLLALARPWVASKETVGQHAVVVVDVSASMGSRDGDGGSGSTRLERARGDALRIIDSLPQEGTAALIVADKHASLAVPFTADRARLRDAVARLEPALSSTDMLEAAKLASALAAREPNTSVWFLSDGGFAPVSDAVGKIAGTVHFVKQGSESQNQGVTALSLVPKEGSTQLFVQIANASTLTQTRHLDLSVDDEPWTARSVTLGPGAAAEVFVDDVPLGSRIVQASLGGEDALAADDSAWVVNRASVPGHVLLVTPGNKFLQLALALLPSVVLYEVAPGDYQPGALLDGQQADVTILDGGLPATLYQNLPGGNLMVIAPPVSSGLVDVRGVVTDLQITSGGQSGTPVAAPGQAAVDPLLRYADIGSAHISRAARIGLPDWARPLVMSDKGPLLFAGEQGDRKVVVSAFDFHDSDLPLQTSFPLLIRNLITYLLPPPAGGLPSDVASGSPLGIDAEDPSVDRIVVEDPLAKEWTAALTADRRRTSFENTTQPGVYYVTQYRGAEIVAQEAFTVNLLSRDESMTRPNDAPGLPAGLTPDEIGAVSGSGLQRELWPAIVLAAMALLLLEWAYAQRMVIRRLVTEWQTRRRLSRAGRT